MTVIMVENGHKHLDREEDRVHAGHPPTPRADIMMAAAKNFFICSFDAEN